MKAKILILAIYLTGCFASTQAQQIKETVTIPVTINHIARALNIDSLFKRVAILEKRVDSLQLIIKPKRREKRPK